MKTAYLTHILYWMLPVLAGQWLIAGRIFRANLGAILWPAAILGTYLSAADWAAVRSGVWYFDERQILGWKLGGVLPLEEAMFFYLTSLLVAQSLVMFLPDSHRAPVVAEHGCNREPDSTGFHTELTEKRGKDTETEKTQLIRKAGKQEGTTL